MKICVSLIFVLTIALQALCFGGKLRIEETVFDSHSSTTTQTTRCELPRITGEVKDMSTAFTPNYTLIPNAKITYQPIEANNKATDIRNRKIIYSDSEGFFELCNLMFNGSDTCKYLVTAKNIGYGWAKEIIELSNLHMYGISIRDEYFAFDVSLGLWPKWTKQRHKAYIQGKLYLEFQDPVEGYDNYKALSDVKIKVKGLKTKYKASIVSESEGDFETDYLKTDSYILTMTYDGKTYRKKIILPKSTTYNYVWVIEQE